MSLNFPEGHGQGAQATLLAPEGTVSGDESSKDSGAVETSILACSPNTEEFDVRANSSQIQTPKTKGRRYGETEAGKKARAAARKKTKADYEKRQWADPAAVQRRKDRDSERHRRKKRADAQRLEAIATERIVEHYGLEQLLSPDPASIAGPSPTLDQQQDPTAASLDSQRGLLNFLPTKYSQDQQPNHHHFNSASFVQDPGQRSFNTIEMSMQSLEMTNQPFPFFPDTKSGLPAPSGVPTKPKTASLRPSQSCMPEPPQSFGTMNNSEFLDFTNSCIDPTLFSHETNP